MKMLLVFGTVIVLLLGRAALAAFPDWYPEAGFQHYGEVDYVSMKNMIVVIGDYEYRFSDNTILHSLSEESDSLARLHKGTTVGFTYDKDTEGHKLIREIWLLPENYAHPDEAAGQPHGL